MSYVIIYVICNMYNNNGKNKNNGHTYIIYATQVPSARTQTVCFVEALVQSLLKLVFNLSLKGHREASQEGVNDS